MTTKTILTLSFIFLFSSCKNSDTQSVKLSSQQDSNKNNSKNAKYDWHKLEVFGEKDILIDSKLSRFTNYKDFIKVFGEPDSIANSAYLGLCYSIFEGIDSKFIYKDSSTFEMLNKKIALSEFRFCKNNFIKMKDYTLNSNQTIETLKSTFPYPIEHISKINVYQEGVLDVIKLKINDETSVDDFCILMFFKNEHLYMIHWFQWC